MSYSFLSVVLNMCVSAYIKWTIKKSNAFILCPYTQCRQIFVWYTHSSAICYLTNSSSYSIASLQSTCCFFLVHTHSSLAYSARELYRVGAETHEKLSTYSIINEDNGGFNDDYGASTARQRVCWSINRVDSIHTLTHTHRSVSYSLFLFSSFHFFLSSFSSYTHIRSRLTLARSFHLCWLLFCHCERIMR